MLAGIYWKEAQPHMSAVTFLPVLVIHMACDECGHMPGFELRFALWFGTFVISCFFGEADPRFLQDLGLLPETPHEHNHERRPEADNDERTGGED